MLRAEWNMQSSDVCIRHYANKAFLTILHMMALIAFGAASTTIEASHTDSGPLLSIITPWIPQTHHHYYNQPAFQVGTFSFADHKWKWFGLEQINIAFCEACCTEISSLLSQNIVTSTKSCLRTALFSSNTILDMHQPFYSPVSFPSLRLEYGWCRTFHYTSCMVLERLYAACAV